MDTAVNTKNIYGKQIMDTTKKQSINFAKTFDKKILDKNAIATGDFIGNNIVDKISSLGNKANENDEKKKKKQEEIIISLEKKRTNY